jgi:ribose transport system ATP-binding protein
MIPSPATVLSMRGIVKRFGGVAAVAGVDLDVGAGEVHALVGENGAGKSTLMKVLSGAYAPDGGTMTLAGEPYAPRHPQEARARGVAMIYQELTLCPHLTVAENIVLGREPRRHGVVDRVAMRDEAERALAWLDHSDLAPDRRVGGLAPGARQVVEIARAIAGNARVMVMDEPTSSLSKPEAEQLFATIDRLRARGAGIVYISHFLEEIRRVADRYTVLRDGRSVASGEVGGGSDDGFAGRVLEAMAGRTVDETYPRVAHERGEPVLELDELTGVRLPDRARLLLHRGEVLGIAGLVGAGRTELLRAAFGLDPVRSGRIRIATVWDRGAPPWTRLRQGVGLLSEDRKEEGLAPGLSVADNITLSSPPARFGFISGAARDAAALSLGARLSLRARDPRQMVAELSGGNQQKIAVARLLHHDVDVLLLDEPTRGIDVASKADLYRTIGELARAGKGVLFVSSYLPELLGVCDRIAVMTRGRLGEPRPAADWSSTSLLEAATGTANG